MEAKNIFIISGPSGAGEDSIIKGLVKILSAEWIITTTTRAMRPGENQGNPYYFVSRSEFETGVNESRFFEHACQYNNELYGVTFEEINRVISSGKIGLWKIEIQGVIKAKEMIPGIIAILISAPLDELENRIRRRDAVTESYIKERMEYTKKWLELKDIYDYEILNLNGKLQETIRKIAEIIKKHFRP
jgi:guanylate kinase